MSPTIVPGTTSTSNPRSSIRRENGLIRRKSERGSWEYEDTKLGDPERVEFDTEDLIDAAVDIYLNPRKSSPTIRDPRQFERTLEDLRRRAAIGGRWTGYGRLLCLAEGQVGFAILAR
jgi:hypothetical protein